MLKPDLKAFQTNLSIERSDELIAKSDKRKVFGPLSVEGAKPIAVDSESIFRPLIRLLDPMDNQAFIGDETGLQGEQVVICLRIREV